MADYNTRSNLPENVLPRSNGLIYDPLDDESLYLNISEKELRRKGRQMKRQMRKALKGGKKGSEMHPGEYEHKEKLNHSLKPRTERQKHYLAHLDDPNTHIVFGIGPAGSGKTYIAAKWAALSLLEGVFDKIVISRPAVSVSEKHGYLPGDLKEKMEPWLMPIFDVFTEVFGKSRLESFIRLGKIEIAPLAFMRGRTFKNSVILLDEAQNCTSDQMKMFLTRIETGSKMVITGDTKQSDYKDKNGLLDFLTRFSKSEGIEMVRFDNADIVRHHLIATILKMYGEE